MKVVNLNFFLHMSSVLTPLNVCIWISESVRSLTNLGRPTSRVKDSTTSDLDSVFSSSWPMSMMEVLWPRFSFCSLNSPPLDTGMLSRLAISRLTEDRSSSMYMVSISLDANLGNRPPCWPKQEDNQWTNQHNPLNIQNNLRKENNTSWRLLCDIKELNWSEL